ncbi:hypothetical protein ACA910_018122 [Epithemia clementina (nom. ined.)]
MMVVPVVKLVVGAIASTLTVSCLRNCLQTIEIASEERVEHSVSLGLSIQDRLSDIVLTPPSQSDKVDDGDADCSLLLDEFKSLSRKGSLCLFLSCPSISIKDVEGEWNGLLLENNGWVLTQVTSFITNQLFGRGMPWNGKAFDRSSRKGINRFVSRKEGNGETVVLKCHEFGFSQEPSRLLMSVGPDESALTGSSCVALTYSPYHPGLSLWKSMRDELRLVPLPSSSNVQILIGLGYMAWSGGIRNASPFCLWRTKTHRATSPSNRE